MKAIRQLMITLVIAIIINSTKALLVPSGTYSYTISPNNFIKETLMINNDDSLQVNITITKQGYASQWILLPYNSFSINPESSYQLDFYVIIPNSTIEGNYTGNITFNYVTQSSNGSITRTTNFIVESKTYNVINGVWLYDNTAFSINNYKIFFTSLSPPYSCLTKVIKNDVQIFNEPIDNNPTNIDEHLKISITQVYDSLTIKSCRYVVTGDEEYSYQIIDLTETNTSTSDNAEINVYGVLKPSLPVMFELINNRGSLISGKIILSSPVIGTIELEGDGLYPYIINENETGPLAIKAYANSVQIAHKVFTILDGKQSASNSSNYNPIIGSGKLLVIYPTKIKTTDNLVIRVKDNYTGMGIIDAHILIRNPYGQDVESYTNQNGLASFSPESSYWSRGSYTFEIRRAGYEPNPSIYSFQVESSDGDIDMQFYYSNTKVSKTYVNYELIVKLIDHDTEEQVNYNGHGVALSPNNSAYDLKFNDGIARFTPLTNGNYNIEINASSFSSDGLSYQGISDNIEAIIYGYSGTNNDFITVIIIIVSILLIIGLIVFIYKRSKSSDNSRKFPLIRPMSVGIPPNSEQIK